MNNTNNNTNKTINNTNNNTNKTINNTNNNTNINTNQIKTKLLKCLKKITIIILTILLVNLFHWLSIQFLYNYCSKPGIWGLVDNIFSLGSPVCHFVNNIQYNLSNYYVQLWITSGLGIIGLLTF